MLRKTKRVYFDDPGEGSSREKLTRLFKASSIQAGLLILFTLVTACSTPKQRQSNIESFVKLNKNQVETVVIMGINDLHGAIEPVYRESVEEKGTPPISYSAGGASILAYHVQKLRQEFGSQFLLLDAGDQWQGAFESSFNHGESIVQFYNHIGVDAAAIGDHQFDTKEVYGKPRLRSQEILERRLREARFPFISSNIVDSKTHRPPKWPNFKTQAILSAGNLKVGIVSITAPHSSRETESDIVFTDIAKATIENSNALRQKGADVVLLLAHIGISCQSPHNSMQHNRYGIWSKTSVQGACNPESKLVQLLDAIPAGTVDGVIAGHSHKIVHHWINGIPVMQAGARGLYFNLMYLTYDMENKRLLSSLTRIEGPVPVCSQVFSKQSDCDAQGPPPNGGRGKLVSPTFHGEKIYADWSTDHLLKTQHQKALELGSRVVGQAARTIRRSTQQESELGNLVADAIRQSTQADFALLSPGLLRAEIQEGDITLKNVYRALPFNSSVSLLTLTGRELKRILRVSHNGSRGFFSTSGLKVDALSINRRASSKDLDRDGKITHWEVNRLKRIRKENGQRIYNHKWYKLATIDYLAKGGDDLAWPMKQIPEDRVLVDSGKKVRDVVIQYISKFDGKLNSLETPLVNPSNPRLRIRK